MRGRKIIWTVMKCNDKATSQRRTGQLGYGCSNFQSGMMVVRVHGRQLGGMICVDILAAESGGMAGLNGELRHLPVRSVVGWND